MGKIADVLPKPYQLEVSPGVFLPLRPLGLGEMLELFLEEQSTFLSMYSQIEKLQDPDHALDVLTPVIITAQPFVAKVISTAADDPDGVDDAAHLPVTVQLVALHEIWKLSVPDPKKAGELWSAVTALLRQLSEKAEARARLATLQEQHMLSSEAQST